MAEVIGSEKVSEETKKAEVVETTPKYTPAETDIYLKKLRSENEKLRKDSDKKLEQEKEANKLILEEQGKYKELYETTLREAEATKATINSINKKNALMVALRDSEANHPELLESLFKKDGEYNFELDGGKIADWENLLSPVKEKYKTEFGTNVIVGADPSKGNDSKDLFTKSQLDKMTDKEWNAPENYDKVQLSIKNIG